MALNRVLVNWAIKSVLSRLDMSCGVIILAGVMAAGNAHAVKPFAPTAREIKMLPSYCAARLGEDKNAQKLWRERLGRNIYDHIHHYCFGLNFMNRARFETSPQDRKHYLNNAINNFDYVIARWDPGFQLTVSAKNYKAQAQSMLRR